MSEYLRQKLGDATFLFEKERRNSDRQKKIIATLRAKTKRLEKTIADAPHDAYCGSIGRTAPFACTCWKSRVGKKP